MKKNRLNGLLVIVTGIIIIAQFTYSRVGNDRKKGSSKNLFEMSTNAASAGYTDPQGQQGGPVDFTYAANQTVHAVVHVKVRATVEGQEYSDPITQFFYGGNERPQKVTGYGSGVIISPDGYIITNNHVIESADSIGVTLNNGKSYKAKLIGRDPDTDIALLSIDAQGLSTIKFGNSDELQLGEWVLAVGNPFNLGTTVTAGIISAKGRMLDYSGENPYGIESYLQTDAALNPGNSGGALVTIKGDLIGITSAIISPTGAYAGNSFAIPGNLVKKVVADLREYGVVQRAMIGLNISDIPQDVATREKLKEIKGAYIAGITKGGAADEAGLREKDIIIKLDNEMINSPSSLQEFLARHRPGDKVSITFIRDGVEKTVSVILKNREGNTSIILKGMEEGAVFGAKVAPLTSQDKRRLGVENGVKVTNVGEGKLKDIGIRQGDIILSINGRIVNSQDEMLQATNEGRTLESISGIQSNGTQFRLDLNQ